MDAEQLMQLAIDAAQRGVAAGQSPFGCAIMQGDRILAACHNTVWLTTDITAHAEVNALREACRRSQEILLNDAIVATTCEPCPMCMAALHWARVKTVYFGASIEDAASAGFNEMTVSAADLVAQGKSPVQLVPGLLPAECRALFDQWNASNSKAAY